MQDSLKRQWLLLRSIPRYPQRRSTAELWEKLDDEGHKITVRSVQRDLNNLSVDWGFSSKSEGRASYWFWPEGFGVLDVPGLDSAQALVFYFAKQYLAGALPSSQLRQLAPYFDRAVQVLSNESTSVGRWRKRVRVISRGPALAVPDIKAEASAAVHEALQKGKRLDLTYRRRGERATKSYETSIHALVLKDGVTYAIVTFRDYKDLHHIALHRIVRAKLLDKGAVQDFDVDHYIKAQEAFSYPLDPLDDAVVLKLELRLQARIAEHLEERPLSKDQKIESTGAGLSTLTATVANTQELRWWLLGFGDKLEVRNPRSLRSEMAGIAQQLHKLYSK